MIKAGSIFKIGDSFPYQNETFKILIMDVFDCEMIDGQNKYSVKLTTIPVNELVKYNLLEDSVGEIPMLIKKGANINVKANAMTPEIIESIVNKKTKG